MHAFLTALCDNDLSAMYVSEVPKTRDEKREKEAFDNIYGQYVERMNGGDMGCYETRRNHIMAQSRVLILNACLMVSAYRIIESPELKSTLRSMKVTLTGDRERDFSRIQSALSKALRDLETSERNIEAEQSEGGDDITDRSYHLRLMAAMSSHFRFAVTLDLTVGEFCALYNQMREELKHRNKNSNKTHTDGYGRKH